MKSMRLLFYHCVSVLILIFIGCSDIDSIVSTDGVKISISQKGSGEPALVFVHGLGNNRTIWEGQVEYFSKKYQVVSIDLPGHGQSGNNRQNWSIAQFGEDVAQVVKRLDLDQIVLVGFSMGGAVVIETELSIPEKVFGIVLVDALHDPEVMYKEEVSTLIDSMFMDLVTNPTREKFERGKYYTKNPEESFKRIQLMLKDTPKIGWSQSLRDFFRWQNDDMIKLLTIGKAPIIAINSDNQPTDVESFKKYIPTFQVKYLLGVGHMVMWDAPEKFNKFLEESIQSFIDSQISIAE